MSTTGHVNCACRSCQTGQGACLKAPAEHWVVRRPNGTRVGPFGSHADALLWARRAPGGGTPEKQDD